MRDLVIKFTVKKAGLGLKTDVGNYSLWSEIEPEYGQEFGGVAEGERICERTRMVFSGLFG